MDFQGLAVLLASMAGFGALVGVLINVGKYFHIVQDGDAPKWNLAFQIGGLVLLFILRTFLPDIDIKGVDATLAIVAQLATMVLGLLTSLGFAKLTHTVVKGMPLIGKSYSGE